MFWLQELKSRSKFSLPPCSWAGADRFGAAWTFTFVLDGNAKFISVLGVGQEDHLYRKKLCRARQGAEERRSHYTGCLPEASVCLCHGGFPHSGSYLLQQRAPWSGAGGGHWQGGHSHPSVRSYGPCGRLRSVSGHDGPGHPGWLQIQRSSLDAGQSFQHILSGQRVHPQRAHPWPGQPEAVAQGQWPAAAERLHLRYDFLHSIPHQLHQWIHQPGGGRPHPDRDPQRSVCSAGARRAAGWHRGRCHHELQSGQTGVTTIVIV